MKLLKFKINIFRFFIFGSQFQRFFLVNTRSNDPERNMAMNQQNANNFESNGLSKSKKNQYLFDANRNLSPNHGDDDDKDENDIEKLKQKNKDMNFIVGKMQKQLDDLMKEVKRGNDLICELQKEKNKLYDLIEKLQNKSPKRKKSKNNNSEQKTTQKKKEMKPNETRIQNVNEDANFFERDGSTEQSSTAQLQNSHTDAQSNDTPAQEHSNDIDMNVDVPNPEE